ncbi:hypothetical protein bpr_IV054 (plasmid) [Butyrivibrio proteoclasticus B316]|uniref:Uncharacterized protein n=1 Tax=Butyrivibrio proteoclasticus (strain ATCC 51982 / DSM 14932 / B316) TaxID=515622 RepID=E0S4T7_BUTPB|nr:hypothetical protein [Butyrivibrio proteoclasticus]ADL36419.1 hypothetical protein bpr_IV054 [Butyrivibrio proteoclasticus B316]
MFDLLLGLTAIVNSAIEVATVVTANAIGKETKTKMERSEDAMGIWVYPNEIKKENVTVPNDIPVVSKETVYERMHREYVEREAARRVAARHANDGAPQKENKLADWVSDHDELILSILTPGVHFLPEKEMIGMDIDVIADHLFNKISSVESVEKVEGGLEVTVR